MRHDDAFGGAVTGGAESGAWRDRVLDRTLSDAAAASLARAHQLVQATIELLEISGEDVTVQQVADRAGLSLRLLYRYFPSKDALLIAAIEDLQSRRAAELRAQLGAFSDPLDRLVEFFLRTIDYAPTPLHLALARNIHLLATTTPDGVRRAQLPFAELGVELVEAVAQGNPPIAARVPGAAYLVLEMRRSYNHTRLFDAGFGLPAPPPLELARGCLRMLGIDDTVSGGALERAAARRAVEPTRAVS